MIFKALFFIITVFAHHFPTILVNASPGIGIVHANKGNSNEYFFYDTTEYVLIETFGESKNKIEYTNPQKRDHYDNNQLEAEANIKSEITKCLDDFRVVTTLDLLTFRNINSTVSVSSDYSYSVYNELKNAIFQSKEIDKRGSDCLVDVQTKFLALVQNDNEWNVSVARKINGPITKVYGFIMRKKDFYRSFSNLDILEFEQFKIFMASINIVYTRFLESISGDRIILTK
ncbi:hypothetical protein BB560_004522 [Smittium megazygosporum]|uniref:Uncharacterized protein n=1 Tax=Smittium megazygosporum TaxID=133381 RepID=A0A2T9Z973_9FUNG|nr:hypothetical protein BB560_004522 [Smittium megazygosporum]